MLLLLALVWPAICAMSNYEPIDACHYHADFWTFAKGVCSHSDTCVKCFDYMYPYPSPFFPSPTPLHCDASCLTSWPYKLQVDGTHVVETIDDKGVTKRFVIDNNSNAMRRFAHKTPLQNNTPLLTTPSSLTYALSPLRVLVLSPERFLFHQFGSRIAHWARTKGNESNDLMVTLGTYSADGMLENDILDLRDIISEQYLLASDNDILTLTELSPAATLPSATAQVLKNITELLSHYDILLYDHHGTAIMDAGPTADLYYSFACTLLVHVASLTDISLIRYFHMTSAFYMHDYSRLPTSSTSIIDSTSLLSIPSLATEVQSNQYLVLPPSLPAAPLPPISSIQWPRSDSSVFRVVFGGGLMSHTCSGAFIRLVKQLQVLMPAENGSSVEYIILGDGHLREPLVDLVQSLELTIQWYPDIYMESNIAALITLLSTSHLLVDPCPSLDCNAPVYPLAMAVGLPIVLFSTNIGGNALIDSCGGSSNIVVPVPSLGAMAENIALIYNSYAEADIKMSYYNDSVICTNSLRSTAREARNKFSISSVDSIMKLYLSTRATAGAEPATPVPSTVGVNLKDIERCNAMPITASNAGPIPPKANESRAHVQWLSGSFPDPVPPSHLILGDSSDLYVLQGQVPPTSPNVSESHVRLFCGVFTLSSPEHDKQLQTILSTWGKRCDGFLAFSNKTNGALQSVRVNVDGGEDYDNMWQKTRAIWRYIGTYFQNCSDDSSSYDWFLLGGDDLYVVVEQLRDYLSTPEIISHSADTPLYLGRPLRQSYRLVYNNGGAGYLLNRAALALLAHMLDTELCLPLAKVSVEDVLVGHCLGLCGVYPRDTRRIEESNVNHNTSHRDAREIFHWARPGQEYDGYPAYMLHADPVRYGLPAKTGVSCCSSRSVTFQDIRSEHYMQLIHHIIYSRSKQHGVEKVVQVD